MIVPLKFKGITYVYMTILNSISMGVRDTKLQHRLFFPDVLPFVFCALSLFTVTVKDS